MRQICCHCYRPQSVCICHLVQSVESDIDIVILQHPKEVGHSKGTGWLLNQCLLNAQLQVVEMAEQRNTIKPWSVQLGDAILFPAPDALDIAQLSNTQHAAVKRIILLDGTWRQAQQILRGCQNIEQAISLSLQPSQISQYHALRKAKREGALSTMEAAALTLAHFQPDNTVTRLLLDRLDAFIQFQIALSGKPNA